MLKKFLESLGGWKLVNTKKILYFPHVLSPKEKIILVFLLMTALISGGWFVGRIYFQTTKPVPGYGGSLIEGVVGQPHIINPIYSLQDTDRDLARLIYGRLISFDGTGNPIPDLAKSFSISDDGKTYTVLLRDNMRWSDGIPLTADDVIFTVQTILNPAYKSPLRLNWQGVTIKKIDAKTIQFILRAPYSPFLENLAVGILPMHLWEKITPDQSQFNELNIKPVGSGPYKFDSFQQNYDGTFIWYRLSKNPYYYGHGPFIDSVTFMYFSTQAEALGALHKGVIADLGPISLQDASLLDLQKSKVIKIDMPRSIGLFFNSSKAPALADTKVREAISLALNKGKLADLVQSGAIADDHPFPGIVSQGEDNVVNRFNPKKAGELLDTEGWKINQNSGLRTKISGKGKSASSTPLRFNIVTSDVPYLISTAQEVKSELANIGIEVSIQILGFNDLENQVIRPRNYQMLLFGEVYGYELDPFSFWHSTQIKDPGLNVALYADKNADKLLEQARTTDDPLAKEIDLEKLSSKIITDLPAVFLFTQEYLYAVPIYLQGIDIQKISLPSDRFNQIYDWYTQTSRQLK